MGIFIFYCHTTNIIFDNHEPISMTQKKNFLMICWLILTAKFLWLFYAQRFGNDIHYAIFTFLRSCFFLFFLFKRGNLFILFAQSYDIKYSYWNPIICVQFNGFKFFISIPTFVGYLMPKAILIEEK